MKKTIVLIFALSFSSNTFPGNLEKVFGAGIFETEWGMSFEDVSKVYPDHEKSEYTGLTALEIENSRKIMNIVRDDEKIVFGFGTNDKLSSIAIYYDKDDYGELIAKLRENFGLPKKIDNDVGPNVLQWPIDNNIQMTLVYIEAGWSIDVILTIGYLENDTNSKKDLGF